MGIDPQDSERVFGMFKRLHGGEIPGTGIGLALCKKVIDRQGGRIWVESEAGRGATFKFTIPGGNGEPERRRAN
jgi:light-regulated signal transduction histidine kinase (bacteriophytochrome)